MVGFDRGYILGGPDARQPIAVNDSEWMAWLMEIGALVVLDQDRVGRSMVSTIFLAGNHSHGYLGYAPLFFETLIVGGPSHGQAQRYPTWDEATRGHRRIVDELHARTQTDPAIAL